MRKVTRAAVAIGTMAVLTAVALPANAHKDPTKDAKGADCDTWGRKGHEPKKKKPKPSSHHHEGSADTDLVIAKFHNHGGHYVLRRDEGYVEIVGGQGYSEGGNQGGYVQGEVDPGGAPDVDFHFASFAGQTAPYGAGRACVSVADNKVATP